MINIRNSVFETNSSAVHSLVLMNDKDYKAFVNGETLFDWWSETFISKDKVNLEEDPTEFKSYEEFIDMDGYETFDIEETIDGTIIHALGYYGWDG